LKHRHKQISLPDLITHIIIEDTNRKKCVAARAKALSVKANIIEDKPAPKRYEEKPDHKKKNKFNFSGPSGPKPTFKKKGNCFVVEGQVTMHLSADTGSKTTILLRQI